MASSSKGKGKAKEVKINNSYPFDRKYVKTKAGDFTDDIRKALLLEQWGCMVEPNAPGHHWSDHNLKMIKIAFVRSLNGEEKKKFAELDDQVLVDESKARDVVITVINPEETARAEAYEGFFFELACKYGLTCLDLQDIIYNFDPNFEKNTRFLYDSYNKAKEVLSEKAGVEKSEAEKAAREAHEKRLKDLKDQFTKNSVKLLENLVGERPASTPAIPPPPPEQDFEAGDTSMSWSGLTLPYYTQRGSSDGSTTVRAPTVVG
ncbi:hypothetical protein P154DRAFT_610539 [Amniculicola lignicola CBS 123094]|uniref:Uncharacterized protein n=1 Tax=Amniculicola lignicola CBS 123094 TaxID=1392246 RepID=A0A6A5WX19_9PLEO|nr:hypothetical protein P154DRAFT_610539 [Amniculicola lignicola CBS 123094]